MSLVCLEHGNKITLTTQGLMYLFEHSKHHHNLLQGHLEYVMHTFELTSAKVSISLRFPIQIKSFSLFLQWII